MNNTCDTKTICLINNCENYHKLQCCEETRGVDNLLNKYKIDKEKIINLITNDQNFLIENIWTNKGILAVDDNCSCRMGYGEKRSKYTCAQCKNLRRLIDFRYSTLNTPIPIKCGNLVGKDIIIINSTVTRKNLKWKQHVKDKLDKYYSTFPINPSSSGANPSCDEAIHKYIKGDEFTIQTLILWMIEKNFQQNNLSHYPILYTVFICRDIGYMLYDMPSIGIFSELSKNENYFNSNQMKPEVVRCIIIQLLVILTELAKFNFNHGRPSIHSFLFDSEPVSYIYKNIHIKGPLTVKLTDLWNSSATFNHIHYFSKNISSVVLSNNYFLSDKFNFNIIDSIDYYKLNSNNYLLFSYLQTLGVSPSLGSYDFYCLFISLMCQPSFYATVINDLVLYKIWSALWLPSEIISVEDSIIHTHSIDLSHRYSYDFVQPIIFGKSLRCDIITHIWSLIEPGW